MKEKEKIVEETMDHWQLHYQIAIPTNLPIPRIVSKSFKSKKLKYTEFCEFHSLAGEGISVNCKHKAGMIGPFR